MIMRGRHLEELGAEAGQFFRWRFLTPTTWRTAHPFSLSAPRYGDLMRIAVKAPRRREPGDPRRAAGHACAARGPLRRADREPPHRLSVLLIAGGVGITPMRALFETLDIDGGQLTLL